MKILMTVDTAGGVWAYGSELAAALEADGCEVVVASLGPDDPADPRMRHLPCRLEWQDDPWRDVEAAGRWLLDMADEVRPDVIQLSSYALAALPWQAPVVVVAHSCVLSWHDAVRGCSAPPEWGRYCEEVGRGLAAADAVVAPTATMLRAVRRLYSVAGDGRVIHNGVSPHPFAAAPKEPFVLGAGRLWDEAKGLAALDRAAGAVAWPVEVAGNGGRAGASDARLLGPLARNDLRERMGRAAIFAHPARYEPFGLAVLEAALAGCALVLGDIESLRELWDGAAVFVEPGDAGALAEAIGELAANPARRAALAAAAADRALPRNAGEMARNYAGLYASLHERMGAAA